MNTPQQSVLAFGPRETSLPGAVVAHIANQQKSLARLGGEYIRDYISESEEKSFLRHIYRENDKWITELKRRVQHYGYRYDYRDRKISQDMRIGDLPEWVMPLAGRLGKEFFGKRRPKQMIINEYDPGQGIAPHVDCVPCFGPVVVSISLDSTCVMNLTRGGTDSNNSGQVADAESEEIALFLERRSAVVLAGYSRHLWTHGIPPRKNDVIGGQKYPRERRVSLTFRSVTL